MTFDIFLTALVVLILYLSAYFWGRLLEHVFPLLKGVNTSFGYFALFGFFEIAVLFALPLQINTAILMGILLLLLILPVILVPILKIDVKPTKNHRMALILTLLFCVFYFFMSVGWGTNHTTNDTANYTAMVLESSVNSVLGGIDPYKGTLLGSIDPVEDYLGIYYFFGIIIKIIQPLLTTTLVSTVYIWAASFTYWILISEMFMTSIHLLKFYKPKNLLITLLFVLVLLPFYSNAINTYLAFYGNAYRTLAIGALLMVYKLYEDTKEPRILLLQCFVGAAGISFSTSAMSIMAMMVIIMFVTMACVNVEDSKAYQYLLIGALPLIYYAGIVGADQLGLSPFVVEAILLGAILVLILLLQFVPFKHLNPILRIGTTAVSIVVVFVIVRYCFQNGSSWLRFFTPTVTHEYLSLNLFDFSTLASVLQNIIIWSLFVLWLVLSRHNIPEKIYVALFIIIFLNPFTYPFVTKYLMSGVYNRMFDILTNVFTLTLLFVGTVQSFGKSQPIKYALVGILAITGIYPSYTHFTTPLSTFNEPEETFDSWYKLDEYQVDMFEYINANISTSYEERPLFLSQDMAIRGYIPNVRVVFNSYDLRMMYEAENPTESSIRNIMLDFNPYFKYYQHYSLGYSPDTTRLTQELIDSEADYALLYVGQQVLVHDIYHDITFFLDERIYTELYRNDEWVLLQLHS